MSYPVRTFCKAPRSTLCKSSHLSEDQTSEGNSLEESPLTLRCIPTLIKKGDENSNIISFAKADIHIPKKLDTVVYDHFEGMQNGDDKDTLRKIILQLEIGPSQGLKSFYGNCKTAGLLMGKHRYIHIHIYIYIFIYSCI
jgi:hypothetical protein